MTSHIHTLYVNGTIYMRHLQYVYVSSIYIHNIRNIIRIYTRIYVQIREREQNLALSLAKSTACAIKLQ